MISGVLYALLAGLMWGLIFVGPLLVPEYPAMLQSMGRYLALGLIALQRGEQLPLHPPVQIGAGLRGRHIELGRDG